MSKDRVEYNPETDGGFEHFGLNYQLPRAFTATLTRDELPCEVKFRAVLEDGRYATEFVEARRRHKGESVTLETLRDIPVASLVAEAGLTLLYRIEEPEPPFTRFVRRGLKGIAADVVGDVEENTLEHVSILYRIVHACGAPPTRAVAEALGASRATAGRWIADAREEGLLGPAIERRAGEQATRKRKGAK